MSDADDRCLQHIHNNCKIAWFIQLLTAAGHIYQISRPMSSIILFYIFVFILSTKSFGDDLWKVNFSENEFLILSNDEGSR